MHNGLDSIGKLIVYYRACPAGGGRCADQNCRRPTINIVDLIEYYTAICVTENLAGSVRWQYITANGVNVFYGLDTMRCNVAELNIAELF